MYVEQQGRQRVTTLVYKCWLGLEDQPASDWLCYQRTDYLIDGSGHAGWTTWTPLVGSRTALPGSEAASEASEVPSQPKLYNLFQDKQWTARPQAGCPSLVTSAT